MLGNSENSENPADGDSYIDLNLFIQIWLRHGYRGKRTNVYLFVDRRDPRSGNGRPDSLVTPSRPNQPSGFSRLDAFEGDC